MSFPSRSRIEIQEMIQRCDRASEAAERERDLVKDRKERVIRHSWPSDDELAEFDREIARLDAQIDSHQRDKAAFKQALMRMQQNARGKARSGGRSYGDD